MLIYLVMNNGTVNSAWRNRDIALSMAELNFGSNYKVVAVQLSDDDESETVPDIAKDRIRQNQREDTNDDEV